VEALSSNGLPADSLGKLEVNDEVESIGSRSNETSLGRALSALREIIYYSSGVES
jgi:hypothetical protein